eukprot:EC097404.1.p2 GENE.EC097404.1~~EC097404.1.p2  ORF type:complete len:129 (-),score=6.48 EC097404.1:302-688(-)
MPPTFSSLYFQQNETQQMRHTIFFLSQGTKLENTFLNSTKLHKTTIHTNLVLDVTQVLSHVSRFSRIHVTFLPIQTNIKKHNVKKQYYFSIKTLPTYIPSQINQQVYHSFIQNHFIQIQPMSSTYRIY